jgi:antitoxin component YwqK of YwqJK toxin-antitoxin module
VFDGEIDGFNTHWYENGQKSSEWNYKDGKEDGLITMWYENGQMKSEGTWKDGNMISHKEWNEDGSVKE